MTDLAGKLILAVTVPILFGLTRPNTVRSGGAVAGKLAFPGFEATALDATGTKRYDNYDDCTHI